MITDSPKPSALERSPGLFTILIASSGLARSGKDVGLVKVFALKQQRHLSILRHCIREAVAEVELRGMPASLPIARERGECGMRFLVADRGRTYSRQIEKFTDGLCGLLEARMPFPADPQGGLEDRDRRGDRGRVALQHIGERVSFGLASQDGDDRGCIDKHYAF